MGILKVKELQSSNGDTVLGINDDGTINIASQYNPGNVVLSTWDQTTRPTTGLFPGYVGYNTEKRRFELFTGFDDRGDPIWYGVSTRVRFSAYAYDDTQIWDDNEGTMYDKAYVAINSSQIQETLQAFGPRHRLPKPSEPGCARWQPSGSSWSARPSFPSHISGWPSRSTSRSGGPGHRNEDPGWTSGGRTHQ